MRVVDRKTFLTLPAGTIYCKGEPWHFGNIQIKDDSLQDDWFYLDLAWPSASELGEAIQLLTTSLETGSSFSCEEATTRDGCFDQGAVFLVFEKADLLFLRHCVDAALKRC